MPKRLNTVLFGVFFVLIFTLVSCKGVEPVQNTVEKKPKYIFLFIGDGMGMNHVSLTTHYLQTIGSSLSFTGFPAFADCTTYCRNNTITDSGAAGSAIACGEKADYGVISYYPWFSQDSMPRSIAKTAHENGMKVGIITTVSIDHATPAVFYAVNESRSNYYEIGSQLAESDYEFFGGGGFKYPQGQDNSMEDLYLKAQQAGYLVTSDLNIAQNADTSLTGVMFVNSVLESSGDMPYAIDRDEAGGNSLAEIVNSAIKYLDNKKGFFIMVEGGKIDWAAHANDAATIVHEVYDFDLAILEALAFYNLHPDETLIIITSDHETGGISLGNAINEYDSDFSVLGKQKISVVEFAGIVKTYKQSHSVYNISDIYELASSSFYSEAPIYSANDSLRISEAFNYYFTGSCSYTAEEILEHFGSENPVAITFATILSDKAGVGFTTWSHTASTVPVYAIGCKSAWFSGHIDNTGFNRRIRDFMGW
jgi:alkaline phosphatase